MKKTIIKTRNKMKTMKIYAIAFSMLSVLSIVSCSSDDDNVDKVEQVTVYVSAETGTYTPLFSDEPVEGMQIQEKGSTRWSCVHFATITGFTYEKGNEYELLVKKTTLANPPQDDVNIRYELISIV